LCSRKHKAILKVVIRVVWPTHIDYVREILERLDSLRLSKNRIDTRYRVSIQ